MRGDSWPISVGRSRSDAVVVEGEEGTTWVQPADAVGIRKQADHERWTVTVSTWAANSRAVYPSDNEDSVLTAAHGLDRLHADRHSGCRRDGGSSGLDAVRFPGLAAAEAARRERAAGAAPRAARPLDDELRLFSEGGARPDARSAVPVRQADLDDETAALYEELTGAEPQLAEERRYSAERARAHAAAEREYAEPLATRAPPTSAAAARGARPARHSRRRRGRASSPTSRHRGHGRPWRRARTATWPGCVLAGEAKESFALGVLGDRGNAPPAHILAPFRAGALSVRA